MGQTSHSLFHTLFPEPLEKINERLLVEGTWEGLLGHTTAGGATIWVQSRWRLKQMSDDDQPIVVEMNADVTQRENLARELHHRVKNVLAVVQGLARLTFRQSLAGVHEFEERLRALAVAHDVLIQSHWSAVELREVVERALIGLSVIDRVKIEGPEVMLKPNSVMAYVLAFHELAVNAIKYGSLSVVSGAVELKWKINACTCAGLRSTGPYPTLTVRQEQGQLFCSVSSLQN